MNIGFIEDTPLHGGTQIWVTEALRAFLARGQDVTLLAPEGSWMVNQCANSGARIFTYDWDEVTQEGDEHVQIWTEALRQCDVAVCTVHPPREGFHRLGYTLGEIRVAPSISWQLYSVLRLYNTQGTFCLYQEPQVVL